MALSMPIRLLLLAGTATVAVTTTLATTGGRDAATTAPSESLVMPVEPRVEWTPEQPVQGSIVRIVVHDTSAARLTSDVRGSFGEAEVRFESLGDGRFIALAGVPVDAVGGVSLSLELRASEGGARSITHRVPVGSGDFRHERLTVAPQFGRPPDSATAARMAREAALARAVAERSMDTPRLWGDGWVRPRTSRITSGYGHGREFNGAVQSRHMGTDFAGAVGTPVAAANCGVVALVANFLLAGTAVYVDHGAGVVSGYFHLSRADVAEGDTVRTGQVIGRVGQSGRVTGPHLHWILRSNGVTVNPMSVFAADSAGLTPACAAAP